MQAGNEEEQIKIEKVPYIIDSYWCKNSRCCFPF